MAESRFACLEETSVTRRGSEIQLEYRYHRRKGAEIKVYEHVIACSVKVVVTIECSIHNGFYCDFTGICTKEIHCNDPIQYEVQVVSKKLDLDFTTTTENGGTWLKLHIPETFDLCFKLQVVKRNLSFFCDNLELTDFELKGDDGSIRVSKLLLTFYSPVFAKMFCGEWNEKREGCVKIEGTSCATLQHLKNYMYKNTLPETGLEELLLLASCYMISDLQQNCVFKLTDNLSAEKAFDLLAFAGQHRLNSLMVCIMDVVNAKDMKKILVQNIVP